MKRHWSWRSAARFVALLAAVACSVGFAAAPAMGRTVRFGVTVKRQYDR
jgi:hypothetical protein